jgi:hypothetical protein
MTPEEIQRQAAARNNSGVLGEARQRALPPPQARAPGTSLAAAPQPAPEPVASTARTVNRPQPTITVDSQGNAATLDQRTAQSTQQRLAAERAARLDAMNRGGIGALDDVVRQQSGPTAGERRANLGAPPSQPPPAAAQATPAGQPASKPGIAGRIARASGPALAVGVEGLRVAGAANQGGAIGAANETVNAAGRLSAAGIGSRAGATLGSFAGPKGAAVGGILGGIGGYMLGDAGVNAMRQGGEEARQFRESGGAVPMQNADPTTPVRTGLLAGMNTPGLNTREVGLNPTVAQLDAAGVLRPRQQDRPMRTEAAPDIGAQPAPESSQGEASPTAPQAQPAEGDDRVLGTFNGREIRASEAGRLAEQNVVPAAAGPGMAAAAAQDNGQGQLLAMLNQARGDRMGVQRGANDRLSGLYDKFNDQIRQGRRRTAAVIGEQIRAELGVLGQTASGQMIDPRQPGLQRDQAEAGRIGEVTAGQRLENQSRERLARLEEIMFDPEASEEQRAQAATQFQLFTGRGGQQQDDGRIVQLPGEDGFTTVPALLPRGSTQAIPITAAQQQRQAVGQARGPDGKTYNVFADGSTELAQ